MKPLDLKFIQEIDRQFIDEDIPLRNRPFKAVMRWMQQNQIYGDIFADNRQELASALYKQLYPNGNFFVRPLMVGLCFFRGLPYRVRVPGSFGTVAFSPLDWIDICEEEKRIIFNEFTEQYFASIYTVIDLVNFAHAVSSLTHQDNDASHLSSKARSAIEIASVTLLEDVQQDLAVQNSLLACEFALKSALSAKGEPRERLKKMGHNLTVLVDNLTSKSDVSLPTEVIEICKNAPKLVKTRYEHQGLSRSELVQFAVNSQFVANEALGTFCDQVAAIPLNKETPIPERKDIWFN